MSEDQDEIFTYNYGDDFPAALLAIGQALLGGRPLNSNFGPQQIMKMLSTAAVYRAATPRRPGKGKPLPQSDQEKEMEHEARVSAQKACQRLIVPKPKGETPDAFIRRLDAHRQAPEALVIPMTAPEDEMLFAKRMVAVKANENPDVIILPKSSRETDAEFEERLDVCKKTPCPLVFMRGAHESGAQFKTRMSNQIKCKRPILPKSAQEPEKGFADRCKQQTQCEQVIHNFDPEREDEHTYFRRLQVHREKTGLGFEPGDKQALTKWLGEEKEKPVAAKAAEKTEEEGGAAIMKKAAQETEAMKDKEAKLAMELEEKARLEKEAEAEAQAEEERVAQRVTEMKQKAKEAQVAAEAEAARKASFGLEQINIQSIGFMPLKKLLMERGVPKEDVFGAANKFALQAVAKKWAADIKIEWIE